MNVCATCIQDPALVKVVEENLSAYECYYCSRESDRPIACDLRIVVEHMVSFVEEEYNDPAGELPLESKEGGYMGDTIDTWDLLQEELHFELDNNQLFADIVRLFPFPTWCQRHYFSLNELSAQIISWEEFCKAVKSRRRYTFWTNSGIEKTNDEGGIIDPADMLPRLSKFIENYETTLDTHTIFWRVQVLNANEDPDDPNRFTSPPEDKALMSNRMSPAGISMFYGAADMDTACREVVDTSRLEGNKVWAIRFESVIPLHFLDLTSVPVLPSYFSMRMDEGKNDIRFLTYFRDDLAKPIDRDDCQHIEYVPTQVFTEYVRYHMKTGSDDTFHGIIYPSSKTGRPCCVIFANQEQCLDDANFRNGLPQLLGMVPHSLHILDLEIASPGEFRIVSTPTKTEKEIKEEILEEIQRLRERGESEQVIREERYIPAYSDSYAIMRSGFYAAKNVDDPTSFSTRKGILRQQGNWIAKKLEQNEPIEPDDLVP